MKCINPECQETKIRCKGMCENCYHRYRRKGTYKRDVVLNTVKCSYCGTNNPGDKSWRKGMCCACYNRYKKHGSPEIRQKQVHNNEFCIDCGTTDPGSKSWQAQRCRKCYDAMRRNTPEEKKRIRGIQICPKCGLDRKDNPKMTFHKGICRRCWEKSDEFKRKRKPLTEEQLINKRRKRVANMKRKMETDLNFFLHHKIAGRIRRGLLGKRKEFRTEEYVGCSWDELRQYLESQFLDGMTWKNYGEVWHIDHIIPKSSFDFTKEEDIFKCWNYKNLRPEYSNENIIKSDFLPDGITRARNLVEKIGGHLFDKLFGDEDE